MTRPVTVSHLTREKKNKQLMTAAAVRFESHRLTHPSTSPPPESMVERRYTEEEEALEIKSLRRIIAAYAKYAHPSRLSLLP